MSTFNPTWLYIKQHNITGLQYFGKTTRKDPIKYSGSGNRWLNHLKVHGFDITTHWCQLFTTKESLVEYATKFSAENNIVESSLWANLKIENGLDGGGRIKGQYTHSPEVKEKIRVARAKQQNLRTGQKQSSETIDKIKVKRSQQTNIGMRGKTHTEETKLKISQAKKLKGINHE